LLLEQFDFAKQRRLLELESGNGMAGGFSSAVFMRRIWARPVRPLVAFSPYQASQSSLQTTQTAAA
jgi:hypothetical protein